MLIVRVRMTRTAIWAAALKRFMAIKAKPRLNNPYRGCEMVCQDIWTSIAGILRVNHQETTRRVKGMLRTAITTPLSLSCQTARTVTSVPPKALSIYVLAMSTRRRMPLRVAIWALYILVAHTPAATQAIIQV
ncbi:MAG: hypothetical protein A4E54_02071 [Pelotomaculum sp. PtaB.Bin117]|nr:MAG: hypothetical protein A4E54_02071 [Pelotomaculum sp. PtaB.Bin117]OPY60149.1 MAG: hypothetical protein A4E56_02877 [Pelotomaculum sp. PtaU1.Bin065]